MVHGEMKKTVHADGVEVWTKGGVIHCEDGPAVIYPNGHEEWWQNGEKHREDGPAVSGPYSNTEWWVRGELHREDGPAVVGNDGITEFRVHGKLHRVNGPAFIEVHIESGRELYEWYLDNVRIHSEKEFQRLSGRTDEQMQTMREGFGKIH